MTAIKCRRCGLFWTFGGNPDLFTIINRFCPLCLPAVMPLMGVVPMPRRSA